jgi:phage terminase Nu1 subunit (DNA packaging protein)
MKTKRKATPDQLAAARARIDRELANVPASDIEDKMADARREKTKHLADMQDLKLKLMRGEAHRCEHVVGVLGDASSNARARLLGIPTKVARLLLGQRNVAEIEALLREPFQEALDQMVGYDPEVFHQMTKEFVRQETENEHVED